MTDGRGGWKGGDPRLVRTAFAPRFAKTAPGAVSYVPVTNSTTTLGYIWFDDTSDAAYYVPKTSSGPRGNNAGVVWVGRLAKAKAQGLLPSEALAGMVNLEFNDAVGSFDLSDVATAISVDALKDLATQ